MDAVESNDDDEEDDEDEEDEDEPERFRFGIRAPCDCRGVVDNSVGYAGFEDRGNDGDGMLKQRYQRSQTSKRSRSIGSLRLCCRTDSKVRPDLLVVGAFASSSSLCSDRSDACTLPIQVQLSGSSHTSQRFGTVSGLVDLRFCCRRDSRVHVGPSVLIVGASASSLSLESDKSGEHPLPQ